MHFSDTLPTRGWLHLDDGGGSEDPGPVVHPCKSVRPQAAATTTADFAPAASSVAAASAAGLAPAAPPLGEATGSATWPGPESVRAYRVEGVVLLAIGSYFFVGLGKLFGLL